MAKLSYRDAQGVLCECPLTDQATIGRHPNQTIQLLDRVVSKAHAVVRKMPDGGFIVQDGGSRNGTYVNGELLDGASKLTNGDKITIGSTELFFHDDPKTQPLSAGGRVTIHADGMETHIRSRLAGMDKERFLPEVEIKDSASLRRDYEKLRISHELNQSIGLEMDLQVLLQKIMDKAFEIGAG